MRLASRMSMIAAMTGKQPYQFAQSGMSVTVRRTPADDVVTAVQPAAAQALGRSSSIAFAG